MLLNKVIRGLRSVILGLRGITLLGTQGGPSIIRLIGFSLYRLLV